MDKPIWSLLPPVLVMMVGLGVAGVASAGKAIQVANHGVDSPSCGAKDDPCRTISQAIANAPEGGAIEVGPGIYGDVNQNGTLGEAGEEPADVTMISIEKPLKITSRDGAGATIVDAGLAALGGVVIRADDAVFGKPNKGFTVTGTGAIGLELQGEGVTVSGNTITGNGGWGIYAGNGVGSHRIAGNRITGNGVAGIILEDPQVTVIDNLIGGNGDEGVAIRSDANTITRNALIANGSNGIHVESGLGNELAQNSVIGNGAAAIRLEPGAGATITKSNLYGNNLAGSAAADGLENGSGSTITATKNFWGAASGPGADPADDVSGDPVVSDPFTSKAFRIRVKVAR